MTRKWNVAGALAALPAAMRIGLAAPATAQSGGEAARRRTLFQQREAAIGATASLANAGRVPAWRQADPFCAHDQG